MCVWFWLSQWGWDGSVAVLAFGATGTGMPDVLRCSGSLPQQRFIPLPMLAVPHWEPYWRLMESAAHEDSEWVMTWIREWSSNWIRDTWGKEPGGGTSTVVPLIQTIAIQMLVNCNRHYQKILKMLSGYECVLTLLWRNIKRIQKLSSVENLHVPSLNND